MMLVRHIRGGGERTRLFVGEALAKLQNLLTSAAVDFIWRQGVICWLATVAAVDLQLRHLLVYLVSVNSDVSTVHESTNCKVGNGA